MRAIGGSEELGLIMLNRRGVGGCPEEWEYWYISAARKFPLSVAGTTVSGLKSLL